MQHTHKMKATSRAVIFAVLMCCCLSVRAEPIEEHIVKDFSKFSYMALIKVNNTANCSGAITSSRHVLTAASCLMSVKNNVRFIEVLVGSLNATSNATKTFKVARAIVHGKFSNVTFDNDIAILEVIGNLTAVNGSSAIAVWNAASPHTTNCTLAGWMKYQQNPNATSSDVLVSSNATILNDDKCPWDNNTTSKESNFKYCANESFPICARGGPLVCKDKIWGIASKPDQCQTQQSGASFFTRLPPYYSWINAQFTPKNSGSSAIFPSLYIFAITASAYFLMN